MELPQEGRLIFCQDFRRHKHQVRILMYLWDGHQGHPSFVKICPQQSEMQVDNIMIIYQHLPQGKELQHTTSTKPKRSKKRTHTYVEATNSHVIALKNVKTSLVCFYFEQ